MSDIGYNDNVQVYGRKFHVQTATQTAKGLASCEVFEEGRVINKNYVSFERRRQSDEEMLESRIREIVENMHQETLSEIELMFAIAEKIKTMGHAPSHIKMGLLFVNYNLMQDAIAEFRTAISISPDQIDAYNNLGLAYIKALDYASAVKVLKKALLIQPGYADVHHNLGMAYYYENQFHKAIEDIQKALRINPDYQIARYNQALVYLASILNDIEDKDLPPASIRVERALQLLQNLAEVGVKGIRAVTNKVKKALLAKDFKSAVKVLESSKEKVFPAEPHSIIGINFYLRFMYGGKNLTKRSLKKFEEELIESIESNDNYADLWNNLGIVHLIQCRNLFLKALNEFNKALEINPKFEKAIKNKKLVENDGKEFLILLRAILK